MTRRSSLKHALPVLFATQLLACGGLSTEDAQAQCDAEQEARDVTMGGCMDAAAYKECVSAFEDCADEVEASSDCPPSFTCPN